MSSQPNIVLAGFMGTGKTSVGKILADRTKRRFLDTDKVIEQRSKKTVSRIFAEDGQSAFRTLERSVVADLHHPSSLVVATGGGAVLDPVNVYHLLQGGVIICLHATMDTLLARLLAKTDRPLLADEDQETEIHNLMQERQETYNKLPHHIHTDGLTLHQVADQVMEIYATES